MDLDEAKAFLTDHHRAVLATTRRDGRPQLTPVTVALDDEGRVVISTRGPSAKVNNLRREPSASLLVMNDAFFGAFVQIEGTVEIVELPDALPLLEDYYRRVAGEHPDWAEYRQAMANEERVLLRLEIDRVGPAAPR